MNIWLSTSTNWNPGDEFIREALIAVMAPIFAEAGIKPLAFNFCRNPDNYSHKNADGNRLDPERMTLEELKPGLVIHCGTPEWTGQRIVPLLQAARKWNAPVVYLGVGSTGYREFTDADKEALASCSLFVGRDAAAIEEAVNDGCLKREKAVLLPCPAILYPSDRPLPTPCGSLLIWQTSLGPQATTGEVDDVDPNDYDMVAFHYIEDVIAFRQTYPEHPKERQFYSADYHTLANFIRTFRHVTTMRLHGGFVALATAAEVKFIHHDHRTECAVKTWEEFKEGKTEPVFELYSEWTNILRSIINQPTS